MHFSSNRVFLPAVAAAVAVACATTSPRQTLSVVERVEHIEAAAREPMIVEHPGGALFIAGYGEPRPTLWKSDDGGRSWQRVAAGGEAEGAIGNSDVDLAVAADGTLYFASMLFDRTAFEGRQISIGVSEDVGKTWRWTALSARRFDDRPWVRVAPDGTAHVIWNDGSGVWHRLSRDRGATWSSERRVHDKGGSSHLAVGPAGELAVRITPLSASANRYDEGIDLIAVSTDAGSTWRKGPAPGERDWSAQFDAPGLTPRWVEPLAWDAKGNLYSLWTTKSGVHLARSRDRGATWTEWRIATPAAPAFFPFLGPRGEAELVATWFTASDDTFHDLRWTVALIHPGAGDALPVVTASQPQTLESARPRHGRGDVPYNDPGGEYIPVLSLRDGSIAVATPIQNAPAGRLGFTWWRFR